MIPLRRAFSILTSTLLLALLATSTGIAEPDETQEAEEAILRKARAFENSLIRVVRKIRPVTVSIENWRPRRKGDDAALAGGGSGVFISARGHILTNQHVIKGATKLFVTVHDGRRFPAEIVGADERGDIALLKIDPKRIRYINPNRADTERLVEGAWVVAVGSPFFTAKEGEPIATLGIVSGLGRVSGGEFMYGNAVQHDAEINPGNSGGPLFDLNGNLLGINGRISSSGAGGTGPSNTGVGYTIPINQVRNFFEPMLDGERKTKHGDELIGLAIATARDEKGEECGVEVRKIKPGSPAAKSRRGIQLGDVIWQIKADRKYHKIYNATQYLNVMSPLAAGSKVSLFVKRGRRKVTLSNIQLGSD